MSADVNSGRHTCVVPSDTGQSNGWRGDGLVLVVEDENLVLRLAVGMLADLGFDVVAATDAARAIEVFHRHRDQLALVLLDVTIPGTGDGELLSELERAGSDVPIVLASGHDSAELGTRFAGRQVAGFLQKPYRLEQLRATLHRALGR
jgi:DNA-binding NtrC family response regulator